MAINLIISGPASVGKSRLIKYTVQKYKDLKRGISHTTRPPRVGEIDGVDYHFISEDDFAKLIDIGYFAFYKQNHLGHSYGISHDEISSFQNHLGGLLDLDPDGFRYLKDKDNCTVGIYLLPESMRIIESRLRGRYSLKSIELQKEFAYKLHCSIDSIKHAAEYDYVFFNNNLISVACQIHKICELHSSVISKQDVMRWQLSQLGEKYYE